MFCNTFFTIRHLATCDVPWKSVEKVSEGKSSGQNFEIAKNIFFFNFSRKKFLFWAKKGCHRKLFLIFTFHVWAFQNHYISKTSAIDIFTKSVTPLNSTFKKCKQIKFSFVSLSKNFIHNRVVVFLEIFKFCYS